MTKATIAIIGAGHMGTSLLGGLIANHFPANHIFLAEPNAAKLQQAKDQFNIHTTTNNTEAVKSADVIILAVKPDQVSEVTQELADIIQQHKPLIISIAAGVRENHIQQWLGNSIPIVRAMPNTPALIGCGATALYANRYVSQPQRSLAETILRSVGTVVWLQDETLLDIVTALSGSGPAYFYFIMEAMQKAGENLGLPADIAKQLTLQTAYGAARLALESTKSVSELRQQAMTPGGTTEQAVHVLENQHVHAIFAQALRAAAHRANELGELHNR